MTIAQAVAKFDISRACLSKLCCQGFVPGAYKVSENGVFRWELPDRIVITKVKKNTSYGYAFSIPTVIATPPIDLQALDSYVWLHQNDRTTNHIRKKFCCSHQDVQDSLNRGLNRLKRGINPAHGNG